MTGFLNKVANCLKALAFLSLAALAPPLVVAHAQEASQTPAGTGQQPVDGARNLAPAAGDRNGADVQIEELSAPDPNAAGALPTGVKPLGAGMWKSIGGAELAARLERLPSFERSPAMQALTDRMLLSPSAGPRDGPRDSAAPWYIARLRALNARGNWTGAIALAEYGPMSDPSVAEIAFTARLASRPIVETCGAFKTVETAHEGQFWSQLRVICQFAEGDAEGAQLALDVLREKNVSDPAFSVAATKLLGGKAQTNTLTPENAIHVAIWRLASLQLPLQAARSERPEIAAFAGTAGENEITALSGLGTLARQNAALAKSWSSAIAKSQLSPDQVDDPEETAKKLPESAGDAVYVKAIGARSMPAAKASAFAAMLQRGQSRGEFPYTAKILAQEAIAIAPLPETAWAAPEVARVLIYNGDVALAENWFKALSPGSPSDQPTINAIQVHGWLRQPNEARSAVLDRALRWLIDTAAKPGQNRATAQLRLSREAPILSALGVVLPPDAPQDGNSPGRTLGIDGPALLDAMARAADQGAAGEVVLNAALLLNGQGAAAARCQTIAAIVRALTRVGLRAEAKTLALEAILGQGQRSL
jgi:hypothetical protein